MIAFSRAVWAGAGAGGAFRRALSRPLRGQQYQHGIQAGWGVSLFLLAVVVPLGTFAIIIDEIMTVSESNVRGVPPLFQA